MECELVESWLAGSLVRDFIEGLCCLFGSSCNIPGLYVASRGCLAIFGASTLLVMAVLQYSTLQYC